MVRIQIMVSIFRILVQPVARSRTAHRVRRSWRFRATHAVQRSFDSFAF